MNADHRQHDTPDSSGPIPLPDSADVPQDVRDAYQQGQQAQSKHPFDQALETWDAWSSAHAMRQAHQVARDRGDHKALANFDRYPKWTQGPGPLEALAANREVVDLLVGWRWQAMREAREHGHGWQEIGKAVGVDGERAKRDYLERVDRQRLAGERDPELARLLRYDPRWRELADDNDADRAELERRALAYDDPGCPPDRPHTTANREASPER